MLAVLVFAAACSKSTKRPVAPTAVDTQPARPGASANQTGSSSSSSEESPRDDASTLRPIYFAFDSTELTTTARGTLESIQAWLSTRPGDQLALEGHADEQGTTEYNIALGQRRAQAAADYLGRLGIDARRLSVTSFGSERPAATGHDETAWSQNRRVEFRRAGR